MLMDYKPLCSPQSLPGTIAPPPTCLLLVLAATRSTSNPMHVDAKACLPCGFPTYWRNPDTTASLSLVAPEQRLRRAARAVLAHVHGSGGDVAWRLWCRTGSLHQRVSNAAPSSPLERRRRPHFLQILSDRFNSESPPPTRQHHDQLPDSIHFLISGSFPGWPPDGHRASFTKALIGSGHGCLSFAMTEHISATGRPAAVAHQVTALHWHVHLILAAGVWICDCLRHSLRPHSCLVAVELQSQPKSTAPKHL